MKTIMIGAPSSNTGKTIITLGLIRALKNRGLDVSAFKTGPDFIDTKFLEIASGKSAGNLDMHMMGSKGINHALSMNRGEYALIEGVMGYFDGIYNSFENSSYDIAKNLNINSILVYSPQGEMFTVIPKLKGMVDFSNSNIKGIILNRTNEGMYLLLKEQIEKYIDIKVLGYVDENKIFNIGDDQLTMMMEKGNQEIEKTIDKIAGIMEKTISIDGIIHLMKQLDIPEYQYPAKKNIKVGIAYDEAFFFYYSENLKLLENTCKVEYFSPLKDKTIPKSHLLYIGGGYPDLYKRQLSQNHTMLGSIREMGEKGGHIYAEAGGFMYLSKEIDGYPMVGIFNGRARMTDRLQRFGYVNIQINQDTLLGQKGSKLVGNEFHRSIMEISDRPRYTVYKPKGNKEWLCGFRYKNVVGQYPHINFLGNMEAFNYLLNSIGKETGGETPCI